MAIEDHYNQTATTKRLSVVSGSKKDYQDYLAAFSCNVQPLDPSLTQDIEGGFGKDKIMFCEVQDIIEGDRVIIGSDTYRVTGVESYNDTDYPSIHMEVTLRIFKS